MTSFMGIPCSYSREVPELNGDTSIIKHVSYTFSPLMVPTSISLLCHACVLAATKFGKLSFENYEIKAESPEPLDYTRVFGLL